MGRFAGLLLGSIFLLPPALSATDPDSLAEWVARRYGADAFPRVEALHFIFHLKVKGKDIERRWKWFPRQDSVEYQGPDAGGLPVQAAYSRRNHFSMESPRIKEIDGRFINDQYWLLFPLHLVWDKGLKLEAARIDAEDGKHVKGRKEAWRLTVTYPEAGGYTPGDAYDLFIDSTATIRRWIFRKGNIPKTTVEAVWADPEAIGPLWISLERSGAKDGLKIRFQEVRIDTLD